MTTYIVRRLLITIPSLFALTFVIFMIIQIAPGDYFDQWALQPDLDQRQLRQWKREFGADKGWGNQYLRWLRGVLFDIRFARERIRVADFEYSDLAANRNAYKISGNATPILVPQADGTFGFGFNFDAAGAVGVLQRTDNPNTAGQHAWNHWSGDEFRSIEMDLRNDRVHGADIFLRIQDRDGKAFQERRSVAADEPVSVALTDADYARFAVDRKRLKGLFLFARQRGGRPAVLEVAYHAGNAVLARARHALDPARRLALVRNAFPPGLAEPARCDRLTFRIIPDAPPRMTATVTFRDADSNVYATELLLRDNVTTSLSVSLAELRAAGVDTTRMGSISFRSDVRDPSSWTRSGSSRPAAASTSACRTSADPLRTASPCGTTMWPFLKNTMLLNVLAILFTWLLSLPIGIYSATHPYSWSDRAFGFMAYMGLAIPSFFFALLLLYAVTLTYDFNPNNPFYEWLPIGGLTSANYHELDTWGRMMDVARHLVLPVIVLGTGSMAALVRVLRAEFLDKSHMQFVVTARAKGLSNAMVNYKHILRNAITPFVAGFGSLLPTLIGGSAPGGDRFRLPRYRATDAYRGALLRHLRRNGQFPGPAGCCWSSATFSRRHPVGLGRSTDQLQVVAMPPETDSAARRTPGSNTPFRRTVSRLRRNRLAMLGFWILLVLYGGAIFAGFLAPHHYAASARKKAYHPPMITWIHVSDKDGLRWPYIRNSAFEFDENQRKVYRELPGATYPIGFFVTGDRYRLLGLIETRLHLFGLRGVEKFSDNDPNRPMLFLLGSDSFGRDVLSRLLYGSRVSLSVGLVGVAITFVLGMLIGGASGYFGGGTDMVIQRLCEMLMMMPGFYLLLALRAAIPADWSSFETYLAIVVILSFIGWASLARIIRGLVLSISEMDYVTSARAMGVPHSRIIIRHVLPNTFSYAIVAATMSIPGYILGESGLSLIGLGIQDPEASWGNMLALAMDIAQIRFHPWILIPGVLIFVTVMAFNYIGDGLRDALDPHGVRQ